MATAVSEAATAPSTSVALPMISVDLDGVICSPFLNRNLAIKRDLEIPPLPTPIRGDAEAQETRYLFVRRMWQEVRYAGRRPLPRVREGLAELAKVRKPVLVTGRSWLAKEIILRWLDRHGLAEYISEIYPNNTNLSSAQFKLWSVQRLQVAEHIDDDGSVALYLAKHGIKVFLRDWPQNRGLPYPSEAVSVFEDLIEVANGFRGDGS